MPPNPRVPGEPPLSSNPDDEVFLAFGRVFSGTARPGQAVHVLSAAYSPEAPGSPHRSSAVLGPLYMMMGRALERLQVCVLNCVRGVWESGAECETSPGGRVCGGENAVLGPLFMMMGRALERLRVMARSKQYSL